MFDRPLPSRRTLYAALGTAAALFLVVVALLAVQLGLGRDPALGERAAGGATTVTRQAAPASEDDGYADDPYGGEGYEPGYEAAPQAQGEAPLRSGTS
jgi:hypothetical protein